MSEPTGPPARTDSPRGRTGYCAWCRSYATGTLLVQQPDDQGSAFGVPGLYACDPCREVHKLAPLDGQSAA